MQGNIFDRCLLQPPKPKGTLTTCKNPTTGGDKCRKVSKGALSLAVPGSRWYAGAHCGSPTAAPTIFSLYLPQAAVENVAFGR